MHYLRLLLDVLFYRKAHCEKLLLCIATSAVVLPAYPIAGFREMQNNIGISAVACGADEVLVNAGGWKLKTSDFIKKGFQPVRIQVTNQSDQVVSISDASVHFANSDMRALTDQFKCRENLRPLAFFVCTQSICWALAMASLCGVAAGATDAAYPHLGHQRQGRKVVIFSSIAAVCSFSAAFGFFVRTPFYWMNLREANQKLHGILMDALHAGHIIIPPHQNAEKIILVPVGFQRIFSFDVMNEESGATAAKFYVDVR